MNGRFSTFAVTITCLTCSLTASSVSASALLERSDGAGVEGFVLRVGVQTTNLRYSPKPPDDAETLSRTGWTAGFDIRFPIQGLFSIESGLHFESMGDVVKIDGATTIFGIPIELNTKTNTKTTYFVLPARLRLMDPAPMAKPFIRGGFDIAFLVSAKQATRGTLTTATGTAPLDTEDDISGNLSSVDFMLALEGGVEFPIGRDRGFVELGSAWGLRDVSTRGSEGSARNKAISLSFGYVF